MADKPAMVILQGLGVSPGVAIGPVVLRKVDTVDVPEYRVKPAKVKEELQRFTTALGRVRRQLGALKRRASGLSENVAEEISGLMDAHLHMLDGSRLVRGIEQRIRRRHMNAQAAIWSEIMITVEQFEALDDSYLAGRASDVRELGHRLVLACVGKVEVPIEPIEEQGIILAEELTPADTALLNPDKITGFATVLGGPESHTAIMARSLIIPAVLGVRDLLSNVRPGQPIFGQPTPKPTSKSTSGQQISGQPISGQQIIIDGSEGKVILHPSRRVLDQYRRRRDAIHGETQRLSTLRSRPARTRDGKEISLSANIELPRECRSVHDNGAEGIGLLRSEFLFMNRDDLPDEEEQFTILRNIIESMEGKPVTVRTLDVGGEKLATSLGGYLEDVVNPALGLRAVRLSLKFPDLFEAQLAAILRAGAYGRVSILLPMISSGQEIIESRRILEKVTQRLRRKKIPHADPLPPLGIMIETPGAAMAADSLAQLCDFFAIGTNDLTMYTLAIDRGNEQVAQLYNPLHPSLLRLIQFTGQAAWQAGISCSLCGEIAGDPRYTALLIGLGMAEFSMAPVSIPRVKEKIFSIDTAAARRMAHQVVTQTDHEQIVRMLSQFDKEE